ncbi:LacI family DNA-binding transcriptional regulator [Cognatishimia activa]|uniref:Gluconate utilization system GNT-I transcriptional repressor n=1 Tax=Cognatishimia activa TaxID=1715691 RepID=A0A0P1J0G7_9RHOB|nr:LacI family DNA-binding transcriptional regulator [Cognatishimia activa]CUI72853.1 Gluconate utilization system GNT-I transcriptional repressor [Cognatishimia activa]CUK26633.1 Gluconate utilization system GNT-I transcriptional repressor [Cognatishimia activa]
MTINNKTNQKVTLSDVGKLAGVSAMTVSKVLRGTGRIPEETRKRVQAAANELGYVTNQLASLLAGASSNMVGVLIPTARDVVYSDILSAINAELRPAGLRTFIGESYFDPAVDYEQVSSFLSIRPAALILHGGIERKAETIKLLKKQACPVVQIWDVENTDFNINIGPSHADAGKLMAEHFLSLGLKKVGYVGAELELDICAAQRANAFEDALKAQGVDLIRCVAEDLPRQAEGGEVLTRRLLDHYPDIQGIHYLNDAMALGGMRVSYERGISVPDSLKIAGFNATSNVHSVRTKLTTINMSYLDIGTKAAKGVVSLYTGESVDRVQIEPIVLERGNTT